MGTSNLEVIEPILRFVMDINPSSILDMGVGFGKYGFLCREYLELVKNRKHRREGWKVRIDGIEIFAPYIDEHQVAIYDDIFLANICGDTAMKIIKRGYGLYLMTDVFEHLPCWETILTEIPAKASLVVTTPNGYYEQGEVFGNAHETHVAHFDVEKLKSFGVFDTVEVIGDTILGLRR